MLSIENETAVRAYYKINGNVVPLPNPRIVPESVWDGGRDTASAPFQMFPNPCAAQEPVPLKLWRAVLLQRPRKTYAKKKVIIGQGAMQPHLFYIVEGLIEYTYIDNRGGESFLEVFGMGNIFNLQSVFGNDSAIGGFRTLTGCTVTSIPVEEVHWMLESNVSLAKELLAEMARMEGGLVRRLHFCSLSAEFRVEWMLYSLAANSARLAPKQCVCIGLSQEDLARITSTTRVTVTKILRALREKNLIDTVYGGIIVRDLTALKSLIDEQQVL